MAIEAFFKREWRLEADESPLEGAHLIAARRGYTHHGIYVGDGRVVHYSGFSRGWNTGPVEEVSLTEFMRGQPVLARYYTNPRYEAAEIVVRARSRLTENTYHLLTNNCEHFCEWCVLGISRSRQVEELRHRPREMWSRISSSLKRRIRECLGIDSAPSGWAT